MLKKTFFHDDGTFKHFSQDLQISNPHNNNNYNNVILPYYFDDFGTKHVRDDTIAFRKGSTNIPDCQEGFAR
jgi:hypothetical protein